MTCPVCNENAKTKDSRCYVDHVVRVRKCTACGYTFRTVEIDEDIYVRIKEGNKPHVKNK